MICKLCGADVGSHQGPVHKAWHESQHDLEKKIEALTMRVYFLERHNGGLPPTGDPQSHHHQMY